MLDLRLIREKPEFVKAEIEKLNTTAPIDEILDLDTRRRAALTEVEQLKAQRNESSKLVNRTIDAEERNRLIAEMRTLGDQIDKLDADAKAIDESFNDLLLVVPNLPLPEVPVG